ncbi:DegV family protein [Lacticaseibacillus paracasei]|jgi:DegV family protein with EDD domain|nr:DegV family protein [Lacticaseibacillus paracasei]EKP99905.1 DegV family protein [Lacticaseibacillus casei 12A]EKQ03070.1 DegV family protein [Lacticaseibacillus casei 21/1]EKQ12305.1 DegV family protein [Lacticaseibacillus casei A2-362]EPC39237.1 DegV family protein [Lacticaseibacillus paracasei subsp. paracasei Lpp225]EPC39509.1 DegV domain-containing protein [Lacticaseibacillus paracasei subsp. paracasei Lpp219]EPC55922.1 DegV domain-containing protein [Lacticaseibacillus paracasei subs
MANIKIVTDSSVQLTPEEISQHNITVVPLTIMIDNTVYIDGETITRDDFMDEMAAAQNLPKTSQPAVGTFADVFDKLTADGSEVLAIHMTETISGTVNSSRQAAQIAKGKVTVIDSQFTDRAMAFQVLVAAEMAEAGKDMKTILDKLEQVRDNTTLVLGVTNLDNLVKGGRLSRVSGLISSFLNIKVILQLQNGELKALRKGRGMKTINNFIAETIAKMAKLSNIKSVGISTAGAKELGEDIGRRIAEVLPSVPILVRPTDPVIATHTGPGAFAITYYVD